MVRHARVIVGIVTLMAALCSGLPLAAAQAQAAWYPGQLLAAAPLDREWSGLGDVRRIEYVTTGPGGELVPAAALVRIPGGPAPEGGRRVVAWDHGTSGLGQECGLTGSKQLERHTGSTVERLNDAGYAVVAPDYIGLSPNSPGPHPYLQTSTEATATIDAVRAARSAFTGLSPSWAVAGWSQGGHAALGTGRFAPEYAPELDFRGTIALAPATNLENILLRSRPDQPEMPGYVGRAAPMVLAGMTGAQLGHEVGDFLTPQGRQFIGGLSTTCNSQAHTMLSTAEIGAMLTRPLNDPEFAAVMRDYMSIPVSGYQDPILIVHGNYDTVVPLPLTLALVGQFLLNGTQHEVRLLDAGHEDLESLGGMDSALTFLARVLPAG
ncbi:alpha/beta fold hydrolase [Nocardia sp. NBC_01329]|uniref:alpha/beta fold hydrolase n=1 Tax=Nocardia sp. NBC_01329 TaxID=2903594 RepID=UPI002E0EE1E9|nr:lipase family protein [Nocardia sp. NBC_01329]